MEAGGGVVKHPKIVVSLAVTEVALGAWIGWVVATAILSADTLSTAISASVGLLIAVSTAKYGAW